LKIVAEIVKAHAEDTLHPTRKESIWKQSFERKLRQMSRYLFMLPEEKQDPHLQQTVTAIQTLA
jgi:hypothetical protein